MGLKMNKRIWSIVFLGMNTFFLFTNPDPYLGIADYFVFILGFFVMCIFSRIKIKMDDNTIIFFLLMAYNAVGIGIALFYGAFSTGYILSYYMFLILGLFMYSMDYSIAELKILVDSYVLSGAFTSAVLLLQRYDFYGAGNERHSIKFMSNLAIDPNFLAAFLVFPAVVSFAKTLYGFSVKRLIVFGIIFVGIVYTSSRGAVLSFAIGALFVLYGVFHEKRKAKILFRICILALCGCIVILQFVPMNSIIRIINLDSYNDSSNAKRLFDWASGWTAFKKSPLWGYGLQGEMSIIQKVLGIKFISHNTYIAFLLQYGIVGLILPVCGIVKIMLAAKKNYAFLGAMVSSMAASFLVSGEVALFFWLPIFYTMILAKKYNLSEQMKLEKAAARKRAELLQPAETEKRNGAEAV